MRSNLPLIALNPDKKSRLLKIETQVDRQGAVCIRLYFNPSFEYEIEDAFLFPQVSNSIITSGYTVEKSVIKRFLKWIEQFKEITHDHLTWIRETIAFNAMPRRKLIDFFDHPVLAQSAKWLSDKQLRLREFTRPREETFSLLKSSEQRLNELDDTIVLIQSIPDITDLSLRCAYNAEFIAPRLHSVLTELNSLRFLRISLQDERIFLDDEVAIEPGHRQGFKIICRALENLPYLEYLALPGFHSNAEDTAVLCATLQKMKNLTSLNLDKNNFSLEELALLLNTIKRCSTIQKVILPDNVEFNQETKNRELILDLLKQNYSLIEYSGPLMDKVHQTIIPRNVNLFGSKISAWLICRSYINQDGLFAMLHLDILLLLLRFVVGENIRLQPKKYLHQVKSYTHDSHNRNSPFAKVMTLNFDRIMIKNSDKQSLNALSATCRFFRDCTLPARKANKTAQEKAVSMTYK